LCFCSASLAHIILQEKLHTFGILGCALCIVGSVTIVLHAPQEQDIVSVLEVWNLATEPGTNLSLSLSLSLFQSSKLNLVTKTYMIVFVTHCVFF